MRPRNLFKLYSHHFEILYNLPLISGLPLDPILRLSRARTTNNSLNALRAIKDIPNKPVPCSH